MLLFWICWKLWAVQCLNLSVDHSYLFQKEYIIIKLLAVDTCSHFYNAETLMHFYTRQSTVIPCLTS